MQPVNPHIEMRRVDPPENGPNQPVPKGPLEGKTVYEAIHITANTSDNLQITKLKGKFQKDETNHDIVIADSYTVEGKKFFKFIVDWEAKIEGKTDPVIFSQTIFTNVEIPEKGSIQDLEYAEKKAYQLAKSYELIQKNIVKRPPNIKDEDYKKQVDTLKSQNLISFKKDESIKSKHQFSELKAESNNVPLYLSKEKTDKTSRQLFLRLDLIPNQKIILRGGSGINLADFQNKEARGIKASEHDQEYKKHLDLQSKGAKNRFEKHAQSSASKQESVANIRNTDQFKKAKADYLKLVPENETQKNNVITALYKEAGLTELQETHAQMKVEQKIYENARSLLHTVQLVSTGPIIDVDQEVQALKDQIKSLEKKIDDLKLDILDPSKDKIVLVVVQPQPQQNPVSQQAPKVEIELDELSDEIQSFSLEDDEFGSISFEDPPFEANRVLSNTSKLAASEEEILRLKRSEITKNGKALPKDSLSHQLYDHFIQSNLELRKIMGSRNVEEFKYLKAAVEKSLDSNILWFEHVKAESLDKDVNENEKYFEEYKIEYGKLADKRATDEDPTLFTIFNEVLSLIELKRIAHESKDIPVDNVYNEDETSDAETLDDSFEDYSKESASSEEINGNVSTEDLSENSDKI